MTDSFAACIAATLRTHAVLVAVAATLAATTATAQTTPAEPLAALPSLDVPGYMGTWYQVAWFPNRFQKQCVSNTSATYRRVPEGVEVLNRCRLADGRIDDVLGLARPAGSVLAGDKLEPARLEVSLDRKSVV